MHVFRVTGTIITKSAVCHFLQRNNFSHKKLTNLAKQRNELHRQCFMAQCEMYDPDMMVLLTRQGVIDALPCASLGMLWKVSTISVQCH